MADNFLPRTTLRFPMMPFSSLTEEDIEDLMPASNLFNGLSISEDDKNVYIEASVPGVDSKDVDITFNKGILTIKAEKKEEEKRKTYQRRGGRYFFYRIAPGDVDPKKEPEAEYKNGVMTITFAKTPEVKPKKIMVKTARS